MINLIPQEEKKRMTRMFYFQIILLFLIMLDFCILVLVSSIVPAYFLATTKVSVIDSKLATQKVQPLPLFDQQTLDVIKGINSKLDVVEQSEKNKFLISEKVITAILLNKRSDIKITQITYEDDPVDGKKINIIGTAPSRAILLLFRQNLEDNASFKSIDLPISNFIKGSDIQFSLSLIPA